MEGITPKSIKEQNKKNADINKELMKERSKMENEVKLLLLGSGESGKSTFAKQMKIIHMGAYKSSEEQMSFKPLIYQNIIDSMRRLLAAAENFGIEIKDQESKAAFRADDHLSPDLAKIIKNLWDDEGIKATYERRAEFQFIDSAQYFFENIDRIAKSDYVPTVQDILRSRQRTTGVIETLMTVDGITLRMIDVGGQRNERSKWIHFFEDVTAIIFVVAMSEYDLKLEEDEKTNRMHESLKLFGDITNNKWFKDTPVILFLNKKDIFEDKIKRIDLKCCFEEYDGGKDYDKASTYITEKFLAQNERSKAIYTHITTATDTQNINVVFNAVKDVILQKVFKKSGLDI